MDERGGRGELPGGRALDVRAAAAVAAVSRAAVAAVLAEFPGADELGLREGPETFKPRRSPPPKEPGKRAQYLREQIEKWRHDLSRSVERYNELRANGLAALPANDIELCGALPAYRSALEVKSAQITYSLTMVHSLRIELAETLRELGEPPQLILF